MLIGKIISGGQTGVDRGALEAALEFGTPYGGMIPKGRLAEDGQVPLRFDKLVEATRKDYLYRTEQNVINSDATLILSRTGRELKGGTKRTVEFCKKHNKPYFIDNPDEPNETDRGAEVLYWIESELGGDDLVINVAGSRESKDVGVQASTKRYVKWLLIETDYE